MTTTVSQYPKRGYFLIANTTTLELGKFDNTTWGDLSICQLRVYHKKSGAYDYDMRLVASSSEGGPVLAASAWQEFSNTTTGQATNFWLGDLLFEFTDYKLVNAEEYYFRLEMTGYTRATRPNQDNFYLGVWCDWYEPVGSANKGGARLAFGVKR